MHLCHPWVKTKIYTENRVTGSYMYAIFELVADNKSEDLCSFIT